MVCDATANRAGLRPGMPIAAARALLPTVHVVERDAAAEQAAMVRLACWAGNFTPRVSLVPAVADNGCHAMLLDIGACLRLFGGIENLMGRIAAGLREQGVTAQVAAVPVAQAALWLADEAPAEVCLDLDEMQDLLRRLSLDVLPPKAAEALHDFGMRTLGDVRLLPDAALARRIDAEAMLLLLRAFGEVPDPHPLFDFPERFAIALELTAAVESAEMLLFAAHRLVAALAGWLAARHAGIRELTLQLLHRRHATAVTLRFAEATRDKLRIERLLRERLQRLKLDAPVEWLRLEADAIDDLPGQSRALFRSAASNATAMGELVERLRARLGDERVYGLAEVADHRPECATTQRIEGSPTRSHNVAASGPTPPRPFWLLQSPKPLREVAGRPFHEGPLRLLTKAERIESGWWSDQGLGDVSRDYFVAVSAAGNWLWIYRDRKCPGWFLHGFFA